MFSNNPQYSEIYKIGETPIYVPVDTSAYHMSRYVAAGAQNIYSASGATKELLSSFLDKMLELCNDEKQSKTYRTDIGTLCNNLKYRLRYPIDEDCALRMAAIYTFIEGENPDEVNDIFTRRKVELFKSNNDSYTFFLTMGIKCTESWKTLEEHLTDTDYFRTREESLQAMSINQ